MATIDVDASLAGDSDFEGGLFYAGSVVANLAADSEVDSVLLADRGIFSSVSGDSSLGSNLVTNYAITWNVEGDSSTGSPLLGLAQNMTAGFSGDSTLAGDVIEDSSLAEMFGDASFAATPTVHSVASAQFLGASTLFANLTLTLAIVKPAYPLVVPNTQPTGPVQNRSQLRILPPVRKT